MTGFTTAATNVRVWFNTGPAWTRSSSAGDASGFRYADWARDLRSLMANAKEGIELADNHGDRLARYHLYVTRLRTFLKKLPGFDGAEDPLTWLGEELDLLVHHWNSDLLRPAAAARQTPTTASQRFRMIAVLCVEMFVYVGLDEETAREKVAAKIWSRGYRGDKGKFGAAELKNWVIKVDTGEYPMVKETIARMWTAVPSLRSATSEDDARDIMRAMLDRTRMPALARSQIQKQQPLP